MEYIKQKAWEVSGGESRAKYKVALTIDEVKLSIRTMTHQISLLDAQMKQLDEENKTADDTKKQINLSQIATLKNTRERYMNELANIQQKLTELQSNVVNNILNTSMHKIAIAIENSNAINSVNAPKEVNAKFTELYAENKLTNENAFIERMQTFQSPTADDQSIIDDIIEFDAQKSIEAILPTQSKVTTTSVEIVKTAQPMAPTKVSNIPRFVPVRFVEKKKEMEIPLPVKLPDIDDAWLMEDDEKEEENEKEKEKTKNNNKIPVFN